MGADLSMFAMFELIIGVYLLYSAATGRGKLFENEYLKEECPREQYVKVMRILGGITGVLLVIRNLLELRGIAPAGSVVGWIMWAAGLVLIVAMAVYSAKMTDRSAMAKGRTPQQKKSGDPLRAAFVFDDEDQEEKNSEEK